MSLSLGFVLSDIDDILLNAIGVYAGILCGYMILKPWKEKQAAERSPNMSSFDQDKIYTSKSLLQEMNEERALKGKPPLPAINPLRGGTSTIARKDKSWKNVPDFFAKLLKKK